MRRLLDLLVALAVVLVVAAFYLALVHLAQASFV